MTSPTIYGSASEPWTLPDHLVLCREAVLAWRDWGYGDHLKNNFSGLTDLFWWVKCGLRYDKLRNANWPLPEPVWRSVWADSRFCDCEGFALSFATFAHRALGIDPEDIFITVYHDRLGDVVHAVCVIRTDEGNKVLDQRAIEVLDDTPDADIAPIFSINLNGESFLHGRPA